MKMTLLLIALMMLPIFAFSSEECPWFCQWEPFRWKCVTNILEDGGKACVLQPGGSACAVLACDEDDPQDSEYITSLWSIPKSPINDDLGNIAVAIVKMISHHYNLTENPISNLISGTGGITNESIPYSFTFSIRQNEGIQKWVIDIGGHSSVKMNVAHIGDSLLASYESFHGETISGTSIFPQPNMLLLMRKDIASQHAP